MEAGVMIENTTICVMILSPLNRLLSICLTRHWPSKAEREYGAGNKKTLTDCSISVCGTSGTSQNS